MSKNRTLFSATALAAALAMTLPLAAEAHGGKRGWGSAGVDFTALDTDNSGQLSMQEMAGVQALRFSSMDADGDGSLTIEELTSDKENTERAQRRAEKMIRAMDENENGTVEVDEMQIDERRLEKMFSRLDADDSGEISQEEFDDMADRHGKSRKGKDRKGDKNGDKDMS